MMTTGIVMTGHGAMGTAAMPTMTGTLMFAGASVALWTIVLALLVTAFAAICAGAMRQLTVPTVVGIHGPATVARVDRPRKLAAAA